MNGRSRPHGAAPEAVWAAATEDSSATADKSPLRQALLDATGETGCSMKNLTVMSDLTDPFRLDTLAHHRDGKWLADIMATPQPQLDSRWSRIEQTRRLIPSKNNRDRASS